MNKNSKKGLLLGATAVLSLAIFIWVICPAHSFMLDRSLRRTRAVRPLITRPASGTGTNFSEEDMKPFRGFDAWVDSMKRSDSGRRWYDSLVRARPGLMDSVGKAKSFLYFYQLLK